MDHRCSGTQAGDSSGARIGKQVQHAHFPPGGTNPLADKVPVDRLLREESDVFEAHRLDEKGQIPIVDLPLVGHFFIGLPVPSAGV